MHEEKQLRVSLLTGGDDPSYALPLLSALISAKILVDFIGSDRMEKAAIVRNEHVNYLNLRGNQNHYAPMKEKIVRVLRYYLRLIKYASKTESQIFHILWLNKFTYFDRTILNLYYKILGKKLIFTAHNINMGERDRNDTVLNRLTLKFMYKIVDHIFVHTEKMKQQLIEDFDMEKEKIALIPFGINNYVPSSQLASTEAKDRLHLGAELKVMLFFGQIAPYKGLDYLIAALKELTTFYSDIRLIIAGGIKQGWKQYWRNIENVIDSHGLDKYVIKRIGFVPDEEVEIYFKAADVLILPYRDISQTGVLFLGYNFGLPAIATDVGSLREDIIQGKTGFICEAENPRDLAEKIGMYFSSHIYTAREESRRRIRKWATQKYSWEVVAGITHRVYEGLLRNSGD
jgi:D-inositol-3-phosphate glycosyltransferase